MLALKQGSSAVCRGYLQKDLLLQSCSLWEAVGNTCTFQAELTPQAHLPHQILPVSAHPRCAPGALHSPDTLTTNQLLLLFLSTSPAASPVTASVSMCFNSRLAFPLLLPLHVCVFKPLMY